jgi:sec-independent protein translocase protein TatB
MLFDIGWAELMLIGLVALVVIGPKDLPRALRIAGYWVRKARNLSREFHSSVEQMIREAELDEMRQQLKKATEFDLDKELQKTVDPSGSLAESIRPPDLPDFFDPPPTPASLAAEPPEAAPVAALPGAAEPAAALPPPQPEPADAAPHSPGDGLPARPPEPPKP